MLYPKGFFRFSPPPCHSISICTSEYTRERRRHYVYVTNVHAFVILIFPTRIWVSAVVCRVFKTCKRPFKSKAQIIHSLDHCYAALLRAHAHCTYYVYEYVRNLCIYFDFEYLFDLYARYLFYFNSNFCYDLNFVFLLKFYWNIWRFMLIHSFASILISFSIK